MLPVRVLKLLSEPREKPRPLSLPLPMEVLPITVLLLPTSEKPSRLPLAELPVSVLELELLRKKPRPQGYYVAEASDSGRDFTAVRRDIHRSGLY